MIAKAFLKGVAWGLGVGVGAWFGLLIAGNGQDIYTRAQRR